MISISTPAALDIHGEDGTIFHGGIQSWYRTNWQKRAGCGPTTGSNLLRYLALRHPGCAPLCPYQSDDQESFLRLMEDVWGYITPGLRGVNNTSIFAEGAEDYARDRRIPLKANVLSIPTRPAHRPDADEVGDFLARSLGADLPVALLSLSNGSCKNLDSWHWVTLIAFEEDTLFSHILDQGGHRRVDLGLWLRTSTLGGGFVSLVPGARNRP